MDAGELFLKLTSHFKKLALDVWVGFREAADL